MRSPESRLIRQAFRFELDPNRAQRQSLAKSVGASRFVYNWGLAESKRAYALTGTRPRLSELKRRLVALKRGESPWLYEVSAHIGQQALVDLDRAFERFFQGLSGEGPHSGFPRFKRKGERDSARMYEVRLGERHLRLPNIGCVRLKERPSDRGFDGRILSATITRRADRWFCSLTVERKREIPPARRIRRGVDVVGIDLGLRNAAVIHDGSETQFVEARQTLRKNLRRLRRLDRELARKQRGSQNRERAKLRRARLHYRIACQRNNFIHQLSSSLAKAKPAIVLEDLHVRGMARNRCLSLSAVDAGLGELRRQLAYKSEWYGSTLVVVDRFFPSSQLCSGCGTLNGQMRGYEGLRRRQFKCGACGLSLDRDENAAINLRCAGLSELGIAPLPEGLREVTPVREDGSGSAIRRGAKPASVRQEASGRRSRGGTRRSTRQLVEVKLDPWDQPAQGKAASPQRPPLL
jgi:putative transposase